MCGCIIVCGLVGLIVIGLGGFNIIGYLLGWTYLSILYDFFISALYYFIVYGIFYGGIIFLICSICVAIGKALLEFAINLSNEKLRLKQENKGEVVYQKTKEIMFVIILNFLLLIFLIYLASIFKSYYLKLPCTLYVCYVFGLAASFPIPKKELIYNSYYIKDRILINCLINTSIFIGLFFAYEYWNNSIDFTLVKDMYSSKEFIYNLIRKYL